MYPANNTLSIKGNERTKLLQARSRMATVFLYQQSLYHLLSFEVKYLIPCLVTSYDISSQWINVDLAKLSNCHILNDVSLMFL